MSACGTGRPVQRSESVSTRRRAALGALDADETETSFRAQVVKVRAEHAGTVTVRDVDDAIARWIRKCRPSIGRCVPKLHADAPFASRVHLERSIRGRVFAREPQGSEREHLAREDARVA